MSINLLKKSKFFTPERKKAREEKQLLKKIVEGFENAEFKMHLQFIVDNRTKEISSAEALSRWENVSGEVIFPGAYIGLMEKSGLIVRFDYYMFEKVCKKLSEWKGTDFEHITISCNVTRITISEKDFIDKIDKIATKYDFDRSKLIIEITEDAFEKNIEVARNNIRKAKELGFAIALDDIGCAYASLISICEYPIDIVKIDRELLLLTEKENGKKLFLGIASLIRSLELKVVCEGVETEAQNTFVSESNCDYIQGWYYTKGIPENDAENFYREYMKKL